MMVVANVKVVWLAAESPRGHPALWACGQTGIEIPAKGCGHETHLRGLDMLQRVAE